ncbi:hypothetical protein GCM10018784_78540 [Streptomyces hydrogenans]|nr:hypothetical protein GCM10018784_78540 [Streptomyces hydrogenans]
MGGASCRRHPGVPVQAGLDDPDVSHVDHSELPDSTTRPLRPAPEPRLVRTGDTTYDSSRHELTRADVNGRPDGGAPLRDRVLCGEADESFAAAERGGEVEEARWLRGWRAWRWSSRR